jgi:hypothetical protein
MTHTLHIRRATRVINDPRCYNGAYFDSHLVWSPWELWIKDFFYPTEEAATLAARSFCREDQQVKAVAV